MFTDIFSQKWFNGVEFVGSFVGWWVGSFSFPDIIPLLRICCTFPAYVWHMIGNQPAKVVSPSHS